VKALVIIDLRQGMFDVPDFKPWNVEGVVGRVSALYWIRPAELRRRFSLSSTTAGRVAPWRQGRRAFRLGWN
jgi:hypothetical protein